MSDYLLLEVGYNGCDISDIKTQINVPVGDAFWLAGVIYEGLKQNGYAGRFVNIVGQGKSSVSLTVRTVEDGEDGSMLEEAVKLLSPFAAKF